MHAGRRHHGERGQVMPLWIMGSICSLSLAFLAFNYANTVRYQIRAQNAADSTAQDLVAAQVDEFNEMNTLLYAANVEEYRIRRLLDAMLLSVNGVGGCVNVGTKTTEGTCTRTYNDLVPQYNLAVQRYSTDILYLNAVSNENNPTFVGEGVTYTYLGNAYHCTPINITQGDYTALNPTPTSNNRTEQGGDCAVKYTLDASGVRTGLGAVAKDATNVMIPSLGHVDSTYGLDTESANQFVPIKVDLVACVRVPPLIPNFGPIHWPSYVAVGRAAATSAIVEQDWMQPGKICDPYHLLGGPSCSGSGHPFQPTEDYTDVIPDTTITDQNGTAYNWYDVNFGGNDAVPSVANNTFTAPLQSDEMSAYISWWGAVPVQPFGPAPNLSC